jgi:putative transposase
MLHFETTKAWNTKNLNHKWEGVTYYCTRLPHLFPKGASFFITFNLNGAIPKKVIKRLREERDALIKKYTDVQKYDYATAKDFANKHFFANIDKYLDESYEGPHWLKEAEVAQIVKNRIHEIESWGWCKIACYCIMSNHVHLLIDTAVENPEDDNIAPIEKIMQFLKGQTARFANLFLGRTGNHFWAKDYYNRYVRNEREYQNIVAYILNNPVKAKLVTSWEQFPHTYCSLPFTGEKKQ